MVSMNLNCLFAHVLLAFEFGLISQVYSTKWLSLALVGSKNRDTFISTESCDEMGNRLNRRQVEFCKKNIIVMNSIKTGAVEAVSECQHQFRHRRWNCTTMHFDKSPVFGNSANGGIREAAFVQSISSASVAYAVTRSCSSGILGHMCGCDQGRKGTSETGWTWTGCSDDIDFGIGFSKKFVDVHEQGPRAPKPSHVLMNLHNNDAGRLAVKNNIKISCKCHGPTGSCKLKTCWRSLPHFRLVGDHIKEKFDSGTKVEVRLIGSKRVLIPQSPDIKPPTIDDLVFLDTSPDFCIADLAKGTLGTQGRQCNRTSQAIDGCQLLCCERTFTTRQEVKDKRCLCKFHWCCFIQCQKCPTRVEISVCD